MYLSLSLHLIYSSLGANHQMRIFIEVIYIKKGLREPDYGRGKKDVVPTKEWLQPGNKGALDYTLYYRIVFTLRQGDQSFFPNATQSLITAWPWDDGYNNPAEIAFIFLGAIFKRMKEL